MKSTKIFNIQQMVKFLGKYTSLHNYDLQCYLHKSHTDIGITDNELTLYHYCESPHNGDYYDRGETKLSDLPKRFLTLETLSSIEDELFHKCLTKTKAQVEREEARSRQKYLENKTREAIAKEPK